MVFGHCLNVRSMAPLIDQQGEFRRIIGLLLRETHCHGQHACSGYPYLKRYPTVVLKTVNILAEGRYQSLHGSLCVASEAGKPQGKPTEGSDGFYQEGKNIGLT